MTADADSREKEDQNLSDESFAGQWGWDVHRGKAGRTAGWSKPRGNAAVLVMVDGAGSYWDRIIVGETILSALEHFGISYRLHDLVVSLW